MAPLTPPAPTSITPAHEWEVSDTAAIRTASFTRLQSKTWSEYTTSRDFIHCPRLLGDVGVRLCGPSTP